MKRLFSIILALSMLIGLVFPVGIGGFFTETALAANIGDNLFEAGNFENLDEWVGAPRAEGDAGSPDMGGKVLANDNPSVDNNNMVMLDGTGNIMRHPIKLPGNATYKLIVWAKGGTEATMTGVTIGPALGTPREDCRKGNGVLCHDFWCGCDSVRDKLTFTTAEDGGDWVEKSLEFTLDVDFEGEIMIRAWPPTWEKDASWPGPDATLYVSEIRVELLSMTGDVYPVTYSAVNGTGGTITAMVGTSEFDTGASILKDRRITFTANPEPGYAFDKWIVNGTETDGPSTRFPVSVTGDTDVQARFKEANKVTVSYGTNSKSYGTVTATSNGEEFNSGSSIFEGSSLVFRATPSEGYEVRHWTVNGNRVLTTTQLYTIASLEGTLDIEAVFDVIDPSGGRDSAHNGTNKNRLGLNINGPDNIGGPGGSFSKEYLDSINPFGVLRAMGMMNINSHVDPGTELWENRVLPDQPQNGRQGHAWEYIIELANTTRKDIWICLPVRSDDNYIEELAKLMKEKLDPDITLYVEWGNEVWGFQEQIAVNKEMAEQKGIPGAEDNLWNWSLDGRDSRGAYGWGNMQLIRHFAQRSADIAQIFRKVFGEDGAPVSEESRIKPVLTWQVMPDFVSPMMDWLNNHEDSKYHNANEYIYAAGIAPYFQEPPPELCNEEGATAAGFDGDVVEYIHNHMRNSISARGQSVNADGTIPANAGVGSIVTMIASAKEANLVGGVVSYEGGPHHQGQVVSNLAWRTMAQKDPEMTELIKYYIMDNWYDLGGNLFMYFAHTGVSTQYGYWGNLDDFSVEQFTHAPKFAALRQISQVQYTECGVCGKNPCECVVEVGANQIDETLLETASDWAVEYVKQAISTNLVPSELQSMYTQDITRAEFCALAVALYEAVTGSEITGRSTFVDTDDENVEKAASVGIIQGTSIEENLFSPELSFDRDQAAIILTRLASAIGCPFPEAEPTFADNSEIKDWAFSGVGAVQAAGVMSGKSDNLFDPQGKYTREESIITIVRLYNWHTGF